MTKSKEHDWEFADDLEAADDEIYRLKLRCKICGKEAILAKDLKSRDWIWKS